MTVTRGDAANHLYTQFETLAREIGQPLDDDSALGYGPDIDAALRRLGKARADLPAATVDDDDEDAYFALADYYALQRFVRRLATRVDVGADALAPEGNRQRIFDNARELLGMAQAVVEAMGYSTGSDTAWESARLGLDYIEPEVSA